MFLYPHDAWAERVRLAQEATPDWSDAAVDICGDIDPVTGVTCGIKDPYHTTHKHVDHDGAFEFRWRYRVPFQADGIILDLEDMYTL